jgi:hypothetical protein
MLALSAHGRDGRYTYYTCFTRTRYGTKHCANDRLPADRLERAVTRRLWKVLNDHKPIEDAITETGLPSQSNADRPITLVHLRRTRPNPDQSTPHKSHG